MLSTGNSMANQYHSGNYLFSITGSKVCVYTMILLHVLVDHNLLLSVFYHT